MNREKHFMIDVESTNVDFEVDDILEIGIVEMDFVHGYWKPGREFHTFVHTDMSPRTEFAKREMVEVFKQAQATPLRKHEDIRSDIVSWFRSCGVKGHQVLFCGWNASNFDVPFMQAKGYLKKPGYETIDGKDVKVGDHHYRIYEMGGAIQLACDILQRPYDSFKEEIKTAYPMPMPDGKQHDAIYDCHMQIAMLNGLIKVMRECRT